MNRFKILALLIALYSGLPYSLHAQKKEGKKPNIVIIISDDHAYQAISAYGNNLVQTLILIELPKKESCSIRDM